MKLATIGAGCFWCVEAIFRQVDGIYNINSGYSGGFDDNPTYETVCSESTGHAEVIQFNYDSEKISFEKILEIFLSTHNPTTLNRQGADVGSQYRSIILFHDLNQKKIAEDLIERLNDKDTFKAKIVTEVKKFEKFYLAEDYHQNYFEKNPNVPYCAYVIKPKLEKYFKNSKTD